jgi:hypothetical protein
MAKHRKAVRVGRWGSYSSVPVSGLQEAIEDALREYGDVVYQATESGLDAAAYALQDELRAATPKRTKMFAKSWKVEGAGKYKLMRFIGNTKTVKGKSGDPVALANIFEYSTTRGHPFVKDTFESSIDKMAAAVVAEIKKEV